MALGASIQGSVLAGETKGLLLLDVTPLSLGVETLGNLTDRVIERNTIIPAKKSKVYSTAADGQTSVEIKVLQGEREMAADNKLLGNFTLSGIPAAPRGVPQIEVTFDIDANGIVHVSAKDLGTGKEQSITITSSTNMSKDDVEKAVREAEQFASADKERREAIDARNNGDQLVYQAEKTLGEMGDKFPANEKADLESKLAALKDALKGEDVAAIQARTEEAQKALYDASAKVYQAAQAAAQQGAGPEAPGAAPGGDTVVDADYRDVDDNQ